MPVALGLDFGTTSLSAVAVSDDGRLIARATRAHRADVIGRPSGIAEQNPDRLLSTALDVLAGLVEQLPEPPACLGLTGQMHGTLLTDAQLQPLTNLITWQDKRSLNDTGGGPTSLDRFRAACDSDAVARTGCTPSPGYLAVTLFALQQQGAVPPETRYALIVADWAAARLTGTTPVTDRTNAASTGVFDLQRDEWSTLIESTGLPREFFPRVIESGQVVGRLTSDLAARCGLLVGLPVCGAIGDHQAAVLGSLPPDEQAVQVNIGTGGQVSLPVADFQRTPLSDLRYLPDQRFLLVGAGMAGGDAYAWVRKTVSEWLHLFGTEVSDEELFARLNDLAAAVPPGCDGLRCEPFFRGTRREPDRRGLFSGVSSDNFTPGHVARAVLEGIAEALAGFVRHHTIAAGEGPLFRRVIATGNAVRRNPLLADCLARAFRLPVFVPEQEEEAAYGAAILAGVRTGLWPDLTTAGRRFRLIHLTTADDRV